MFGVGCHWPHLKPFQHCIASSVPSRPYPRINEQVSPIVEDVRARGDEAVHEYTAKFDRVQLDAVCTPIEVRGWMRKDE